MKPPPPTLHEEKRLWQAGYTHIAGIDEAGRGALAGPVTAGVVVVDGSKWAANIWSAVRDSKLLSPVERERLALEIKTEARAWGVGSASAQEIDTIGIAPATKLAMARAVEMLTPSPDYLLIDWVRLTTINIAQESFVKGDQRIVSIAAASILAKTHRDGLLVALETEFPGYGFAQHKGYATSAHLAALEAHGPCPDHRHTFAPIAQMPTLFE